MKHPPIKTIFITSHPTQYHSPFFRRLAQEKSIDLSVIYCRDFGINQVSWDPGFRRMISWDIPLLDGYHHIFMPNLSPRPSSGFTGQFNPGLVKTLLHNRPEVVIVHGWMTISNWMAIFCARILKIPVILKGETDLTRKRSRLKLMLKRLPMKALVKSAKAGLYSCQANRDFFLDLGFKPKELFFFPCAVDNEFFQAAAQTSTLSPGLRKELGLPEETILIVSAGKLIDRKRPLDLVHAVLSLKKRIPLALLLVGDGILRKKIESIPGTKGCVFITGFVNQSKISRFYNQANIFALASEWDPSPKALNEAMNFGLPLLVSTGVGTARDLVFPDQNGFLFEPGNQKSICQGIKDMLTDQRKLKKMGEKSREIVANWSFEAEVKGTLEAIKQVRRKK